ncbi:hypothetical protein REPUB_Repub05bG0065900 [Reevesia pubescens]
MDKPIWAVTMLSLYFRVQVNIRGRHLCVDTARGLGSSHLLRTISCILLLYDYFYYREHLLIVYELLKANLFEFHKFNRESGGEVYFTMPRLQVIDLGSSCFEIDHLYSYVQSRSYRAPEVILGLPYDKKIDVWSLGCILAELCTGNVSIGLL